MQEPPLQTSTIDRSADFTFPNAATMRAPMSGLIICHAAMFRLVSRSGSRRLDRSNRRCATFDRRCDHLQGGHVRERPLHVGPHRIVEIGRPVIVVIVVGILRRRFRRMRARRSLVHPLEFSRWHWLPLMPVGRLWFYALRTLLYFESYFDRRQSQLERFNRTNDEATPNLDEKMNWGTLF